MLPPPVNPDKTPSYNESLLLVTRYGSWTVVIYEVVFVIFYAASNYPLPVVMVDSLSCLLGFLAVWLSRTEKWRPAAALSLSVALYLSTIISSLYTGGINSSSLVWLPFMPVAGAMVAGRKMGFGLSLLCLLTVAAMFILNRVMGIDLTIQPASDLDRLIDLSLVLLAITALAWYNESAKKQAMKQLEEARTQMHELATVDPLTGAYNRRQFFTYSRELSENTPERHGEISILMLDIDRFKRVNDIYGHAAGDQILIGLVHLVSNALRKQDILARFGGEEFVIYLPDTHINAAAHIAERLRGLIETTPIQTDAGPLAITVSLGAAWGAENTPFAVENVIRRADSAMYQAKNGGRNRVEVWTEPESMPPVQDSGSK
jgi:diguanylate cyclase (GGDEF)-like protein